MERLTLDFIKSQFKKEGYILLTKESDQRWRCDQSQVEIEGNRMEFHYLTTDDL